jgi:eukaryotic-like serine/threonine-protein kinase
MATVFLAQDLRHDRPVALKVLRSELAASIGTERFLHEIKITAHLRHPHILPVFDSGEAAGELWYTMPFVEGESLRQLLARQQTLDIPDAVRITSEISSALGHAHRHGIVHRDVKPENILLEDRQAVLADFGVARAINVAGGERLTSAGLAVGTPAYMSPEEASGSEAVDGRADIYALGCVLYEMLSGEPPFVGTTPQAVIAQRFCGTPTPVAKRRPGIPRAVTSALEKALALWPQDRFNSADEFAAALESTHVPIRSRLPFAGLRMRSGRGLTLIGLALVLCVGGIALWRREASTTPRSVPAGLLSVAVLPFKNTGVARDEHFANGIADEIRGRLARLTGLQVIASGSADKYKDSPKPLEQVGRELGAQYLLVGKVRRERGENGVARVRVSPELIQVANVPAATTRWQRVFDTLVADVAQVQTSIAREVAGALDLEVEPGEDQVFGLSQRRDPEAYEAYLKGQEIMRQGASGPGDLQRAIDEFRRAVARDSAFAAAWAQMGWAKAALWRNASKGDELLEEAKRDGERALRLGDAEAEARQVLALYQLLKGNRGAARAETQKGLQVDPSNARLVGYMASFLELEGRWTEGLNYRRRAATLDPTAAGHAAGLATTLLWLRRHPEARVAADRYVILGPSNPEAYQLRAMVSLADGNLEEARRIIRAGEAHVPANELLAFVATYWDLFWLLDERQQSRLLRLTPTEFYGDTVWWQIASAATRMMRRDTAGARSQAELARRALIAQLGEDAAGASLYSRLGLVNSYLGRTEEALRASQQSISLLPIAKDALVGALLVYRLACVQARLGRQSEALATLETLLAIPFYVSPAWLRIDPNFDRLRNNPRFRTLARLENTSTGTGAKGSAPTR